MPNVEDSGNVTFDRLVVPLASEPYHWYEEKRKTWELRPYGESFSEDHVFYNRHVELRKGSSTTASIWGRIAYVVVAETVESMFSDVAFYKVVPTANSKEEAVESVNELLDSPAEPSKYIAFQITHDIEQIELAPSYFDAVVHGRKTTTIRQGCRKYNAGPAVFFSGNGHIPIMIHDVEYRCRNELDEEDAIADGFSTLSALQSALDEHYPEMAEDDPVSIVKFHPSLK